MKAPAFQMYAGDYFVDTVFWTNREIGAYTRLLLLEWTNGPLPSDLKVLAKSVQETHQKFITIWKQIQIKFQPNTEGLLVNIRLEETRHQQQEYSDKQREKGKKRAAIMWEGHIATATTTAIHRLQPKDSPPSSTSSSLKRKVYKKKVALSDEEWFAYLHSNPAYEGIDIENQKGKCEAWCVTKGRLFTRRMFVNWLNRAEKPIKAKRESLWASEVDLDNN
jgi:uncharacterized protein YdaU (DUF1376 family)